MLLLSQNHQCGKWLGNILIYVVLLFGTLCIFVIIWYENLELESLKFEICHLVFSS